MSATPAPTQVRPYRPALAYFAALGSVWVFVLVTLGAFTTSINAGMAFADWPLSNGSINPEGWLSDIMMFAEHSHRLSGATMGLITIGLAVWLWRTDTRSWLRALGWWALAIVVIQGVIGGQRVTLDAMRVPGFEMTLGQMLRIPHGILAQVFVCLLFAIAASTSRNWLRPPTGSFAASAALRRLAIVSTLLVFVQLVIAAVMRHNHAGLAIPTFPLTPGGGLTPAVWSFHTSIHFAHRAMAAVLGFVLVWLAVKVWRDPAASSGLKQLAAILVALLIAQIALGAYVIWSLRNPYTTTAHVIVGACILAVTFLMTWWLHHDVLERRSESTAARSGGAVAGKLAGA
jgi:heme a synthase